LALAAAGTVEEEIILLLSPIGHEEFTPNNDKE
jgi:hypothetical protein